MVREFNVPVWMRDTNRLIKRAANLQNGFKITPAVNEAENDAPNVVHEYIYPINFDLSQGKCKISQKNEVLFFISIMDPVSVHRIYVELVKSFEIQKSECSLDICRQKNDIRIASHQKYLNAWTLDDDREDTLDDLFALQMFKNFLDML